MLQIADFIGKAVLHRLAELLIAAEKRLQTSRHRIRCVTDTHKLNLITVLLCKGAVANCRSAKGDNNKLFLRHSQTHQTLAQKRRCSSAKTVTCKHQIRIRVFAYTLEQSTQLAVLINYATAQYGIYIAVKACMYRRAILRHRLRRQLLHLR